MRPTVEDIAVPPFPPGTRWMGGEPAAVERMCARGPLLVHFLDFAQLNSVRALPYLRAWQERYEPLGLTMLGVNSPRYPFTAESAALASGLARLEVGIRSPPMRPTRSGAPTAARSGRRSSSGDRAARSAGTTSARASTGAPRRRSRRSCAPPGVDGELPEPLEPLRPSDAPGALVAAPSEEVFPGGSADEPWTGEASGAPLELGYEAAGAFASLDGEGTLQVSLDGGGRRAIAIGAPGLYPLAEHPAHERHRIALRPSPGVRVWSVASRPGSRGYVIPTYQRPNSMPNAPKAGISTLR